MWSYSKPKCNYTPRRKEKKYFFWLMWFFLGGVVRGAVHKVFVNSILRSKNYSEKTASMINL